MSQTGTSIQGHLDSITVLLAVGTKKSLINKYFIIIDKHAIPCKSPDSLACFDELFKAHFGFGTSYNHDLTNVYNFLQTTIYEIDVANTKVSPRVAEVRARMLHWVVLNSKMLCFLCKCRQADVNSLIKHFKLVHGLCSGKTLRLVLVSLVVHKLMVHSLVLESFLQAMDWGYEMAEVLQVPVETKVLTVRWAKRSGIGLGLVVCVTVHCEMPVFHRIHYVVQDGKLLLVTFAWQTLCLAEHFNAFKVVCTKIGPHIIDVTELLCHKVLDVQTSYGSDNSEMFIVPYHFL